MASFLNQTGLPRGIRNNNPGNIKRGSSAWKGKIPFVQSADTTFEQFTTVEYGLRACMVLLSNYYNKNGLNTVAKIIGKWAPAGAENPHQKAYINHVVSKIPTIKSANDVLNLNDKFTLLHFTQAVCEFENGVSQADTHLKEEYYYSAYELFKNGNTTISEVTTGVATPVTGKIGSILTIVLLAVLTVIAIKS